MDFGGSDESIEEEDELDAEPYLLIDKLKIQFIIVCRYRKEPALDEGKDPLHWWGGHEGYNFQDLRAGEETPLRSSHQDSGGEGVQLDGLLNERWMNE